MEWVPYIGPLVGLAGLILTIWWKVEGKIDKAKEAADKASSDLAAHKLHAAETFATKAGMQEQTAQIMRAIEGVGNRIDGVHERLDRLYESPPARRTTRQ